MKLHVRLQPLGGTIRPRPAAGGASVPASRLVSSLAPPKPGAAHPAVAGRPAIAGRQCGSILIIVLWITFGLVAITLFFANSMSSELRAADNRVCSLGADQAIEGAARYVAQVLTDQATNGIVPYYTDYASEAVLVGDSHFWMIGRNDGQSAADQMTFGLVDEGAKLNLNNPDITAEMLEMLPGMTSEFAAAIIDWRDANEDITSGGAEAETYSRLRPPYACKNADFDTVNELRLVAGATQELLFGEDLNQNGVLDPNETDLDRDGIADSGILEYVTVYSREPNTRADGTARVNVNQRQELSTLLQEQFSTAQANQILARLGPPTRQFSSLLTFYVASGMSEAEFMQIEADITTESGAFIEGRVNVNTASAAVLACIPQIGEDKAIELVNYRLSNAESLNSVAWVKNILTSEQMEQAGPFLTGQTYVFTADLAALGPFGRGYRRTRFVFDLTEGAPKIIYRQNLNALGWALGAEVRQTWLASATP
jgi:type II secretory pathway component PulK